MAPEYLFSKASLLLVNICFCVADPEPPFLGGSGAVAIFLFGRSREQEPPF